MAFKTILIEQDEGIVTLSLNRPPVNALNTTVGAELREALDQIDHDSAARAVIITGSGDRAFAAGADIRELQDLTGPERTHAVLGVQGLAPYMFEVDAAAFLSTKGDLTARIEAELDQRITQRLILQPRGEVNLSAQDIPELGVGAGFDSVELGLRLRYEFAREFAPYVGIEQEWKVGQSADYARLAGEDPSVTNYVVGVRFWF